MSRGYLVETLYNFVKLLLLQCHMLETASLDVFFFLLYSLNVLFFKSSETQVFLKYIYGRITKRFSSSIS